ncbi:TIGR03364 family FAD-dependent oxidoreductase [Tenacibaculum discolor]|uniref:TIGR03364 family FAD-dependent oxidoreductase n=1 Tax=Tenacibaculum discolor TaxID=361581 RepID=A0A2G1BUC0_9FLAO|nr:TIGR03364 family FAD-dependent oxidoreductase [Tenacibaculum discolor]MDP2541943.1 TIGR03364 family FAD-dependent oxidoreductase [Tenacibaculum discolor]PHN97642.1 TIGR03364 family FAD-dependent oxidoreductase [Tenacibaculum discolor]PHO00082.1 TIGR03364 family FAD-dependent oxidoreductase [Rhodobacteraceae bacterium 4F10]
MNHKYDLIVVGGGVLGTFHAYHAAKKGLSVAILEKDNKPQGATVRNFGQVVPSGMNQKWQNYGRESLTIYKSIQEQFDVSIRQNGTVYIASNEEEVQLIEELYQINKNNSYTSQLLTKKQCLDKYASLRSDYCKAGLFFPEEVTVEPRVMILRLHEFMKKELNVTIRYNTNVIATNNVNGGVSVLTSNSEELLASKVIICNGSDFKTLYPSIYNESDLIVSKLQMMQTKPQKNYQLDGSILTGLTIRRYEAFEECASWNTIKAKENPNSFEKKYGVHLLFKQATDGSVILGDSHEYATAKNIDDLGFDLNEDIDNFMIQEAKKIIDLPTYEIQHRWAGFYSQCKTKDLFEHSVGENIHIVTGIGGKGMTGSAGFSKESINKLF